MTNSCDAIWDLLSIYADGVAGVDDSIAVERHVASCESCASDLAFMRSTSKLIATAPEVEPPSYLHQAIIAATVARRTWLDQARDAMRVPAFRISGLSLAGAAAAAVAVALFMPSPTKPVDRVILQPSTTAQSQPGPIAVGPKKSDRNEEVATSRDVTPPATERRTRTSSPRIERAIVLQPVDKVENPLFATGLPAFNRKPPAPSRRVIANLSSSKNDPKNTAAGGGPVDVSPPMEPLTSPAPPMTMPDGMRVTNAPNVVDPGSPPIKGATAHTSGKIMLTASGSAMSASAAASLAGLRGSLLNQRKESERSLSSAVYRPNETNQVTLDLIKSKF